VEHKTSTLPKQKSAKPKSQPQLASKTQENSKSQTRTGTLKWGKVVSPKIEDELTASLTFSVDAQQYPTQQRKNAERSKPKDIKSKPSEEKQSGTKYSSLKREAKLRKPPNDSISSEFRRSEKVENNAPRRSKTKPLKTASTPKAATLEKPTKSQAKSSKSSSKSAMWLSPKT